MGLDIVVMVAATWMAVMSFVMSTKNFRSLLFFKITPTIISVALVIFWALDRGYIININ